MQNKKADTCGKVYDRMDKLCIYFLAYDSYCPAKYRHNLWMPMRLYLDQAQACAEMAYLEPEPTQKILLLRDSKKFFRMFKRYHSRCEMTGEFHFGKVHSIDILEHISIIEEELGRWISKQNKLVSNGAVATSPESRVELKRSGEGHLPAAE